MTLRDNAPSADTQQSGFFNVIALTVALKVCTIYLTIKNSPWRGFTWSDIMTHCDLHYGIHTLLGCVQPQESLLDSVIAGMSVHVIYSASYSANLLICIAKGHISVRRMSKQANTVECTHLNQCKSNPISEEIFAVTILMQLMGKWNWWNKHFQKRYTERN